MTKKKIKRSQEPYEISRCTIGEILRAKANNGDVDARKAVKHLLKKRYV